MFNLGNFLFNTQPGKIFQSSVRWASKKAGGSSKNRKGHAPGKRRGLKAQDGESVTINSILLRQLGVRCHPGLNVGIGKDGSLYALEAGKLLITCEKFKPNMNNFWVDKTYKDRRGNMGNIYKKYFNIIPEPLEPKFKLVDRI